jgi:UDP-N-acetylmuramate--alanine ligase
MFEKGQKIHLIGIKGVGMTALAQILKARGVVVTGSDGIEEFFTDKVLKRLKIPVLQPFSTTNLPVNANMVISSVAYYFEGKAVRDNPEVVEALNRRLQILTYPEAMEKLTGEYKTVSVAGSHGKSTVTALLGWILEACKVDPTVIVGTRVNEWNANARVSSARSGQAGKEQVMVLEADEYREAFLKYASHGAIVTSIDYDHPDYYATPTAYNHAFKQFVTGIPTTGFLVACGDDLEVAALATYAKARGVKTLTYGFQPSNKIVVRDGGVKRETAARGDPKQLFHIMFNGAEYAGKISFVGKQYVLNSAAAFGAAVMLGMPAEKAIKAIASFPGTARRLEVIKRTKEYTIIDDYAHHPTAITITLEGVRRMYPDKKIICIFQPHMFSRTQALLKEFAKCFSPADEVGVMEIFPSARETEGPVKGKQLAAQAKFHHKSVTYLPTEAAARTYLAQHAKEGNILVLMGAGDVYKLAD